jgi:hypothetical protein
MGLTRAGLVVLVGAGLVSLVGAFLAPLVGVPLALLAPSVALGLAPQLVGGMCHYHHHQSHQNTLGVLTPPHTKGAEEQAQAQ